MNTKSLLTSLFLVLIIVKTAALVSARPPSIHLLVQTSGFSVIDLSQQVSNDGLIVTYKFNRSVATLTRSRLFYNKVSTLGGSSGTSERESASGAATLVFKIPQSAFEVADRIDFQVNLINAVGTTIYTSATSSFDSSFYKSFKNEVRQLNEKASALRNTVTGLEAKNNDLVKERDAANTKYEDAQRSLNVVTRGLEPTRVNLVQVNLVSDDRIVVTFTTEAGVPGRILATIEGPENFKRNVPSDNLSTQHVISFEGLKDATQYRIKAVALKLDKAEIPSSLVDSNGDERLKVRTKERLIPPVSSFALTPSYDRIKVTVNTDQKVFAEVSYQPLDSTGSPIKSELKQIGSIRQDEFGRYSGERVVNANTAEDISLVDLKENTQYKVVVRLVNEFGKTPSNLLEKISRTAVKPTPFDFTKVVNVQMSPVGVKVTWYSTTKALNARLQVFYEGDNSGPQSNPVTQSNTASQSLTVDNKAEVKDNNQIIGVIDTSQVAEMISKSKVPIIRLIMTDGTGQPLQRDLQVTFVLPKNSDVKSLNTLAEPVKSTLLEITKKVEGDGKGIDWKKLISTGFSMFVKTVVPLPL